MRIDMTRKIRVFICVVRDRDEHNANGLQRDFLRIFSNAGRLGLAAMEFFRPEKGWKTGLGRKIGVIIYSKMILTI